MKTSFLTIIAIICILQLNCSSSSSVNKSKGSEYGLNPDQYAYVCKETLPGGKLDYESIFEATRLTVIGNVAYNRKDAALYTWGRTVKKIGIKSAEQAIKLYESIREIELRDPNRRAIQNGLESSD